MKTKEFVTIISLEYDGKDGPAKVKNVREEMKTVYETRKKIEIFYAGDRRQAFRNGKGKLIYVSTCTLHRGDFSLAGMLKAVTLAKLAR